MSRAFLLIAFRIFLSADGNNRTLLYIKHQHRRSISSSTSPCMIIYTSIYSPFHRYEKSARINIATEVTKTK